jgi:hypothetical protein
VTAALGTLFAEGRFRFITYLGDAFYKLGMVSGGSVRPKMIRYAMRRPGHSEAAPAGVRSSRGLFVMLLATFFAQCDGSRSNELMPPMVDAGGSPEGVGQNDAAGGDPGSSGGTVGSPTGGAGGGPAPQSQMLAPGLGQRCQYDRDCMTGSRCARVTNPVWKWQGGFCSTPCKDASDCGSPGGVCFLDFKTGDIAFPFDGMGDHCAIACNSSQPCPRGLTCAGALCNPSTSGLCLPCTRE